MADNIDDPPRNNVLSSIRTIIQNTRETATEEFLNFWGQFHNTAPKPRNDREILVPRGMRQDKFTMSESYGRIIPDSRKGHLVRNAESQTDEETSSFSISDSRKRKIREPSVERESKILRSEYRLERVSSSSSTQDASTSPEEYEPITNNINVEPETTKEHANDDTSQATKPPTDHSDSFRHYKENSPFRKDVMTGQKSVRRLTMELEDTFIPRSPTSSPHQQRHADSLDKLFPHSPKRFENAESPSRVETAISSLLSPKRFDTSPKRLDNVMPPKYRDTTASPNRFDSVVSRADATLPLNRSNVTDHPRKANPPFYQQTSRSLANAKDTSRLWRDSDSEKEFDKRIEKLESTLYTAESQLNKLNTPSSPKPSHTISSTPSSPARYPEDPDRKNIPKASSPLRETHVQPSAIRDTSSPIRYSEDSDWRKIFKTTSPLRETQPSVFRDKSLVSPSPATSPLRFSTQLETLWKERLSASPKRTTIENTNRSSPVTHAPSSAAKASPEANPNDNHKSKMRELIQLIPAVKLRKTDTIIGPDGLRKPNPFWNEIYGKKRNY